MKSSTESAGLTAKRTTERLESTAMRSHVQMVETCLLLAPCLNCRYSSSVEARGAGVLLLVVGDDVGVSWPLVMGRNTAGVRMTEGHATRILVRSRAECDSATTWP
jgi:hypothetical protein